MLKLVRLTEDYPLGSFDCGDSDLNEFLADDALPFQEKRIAITYVVILDDKVVAYYSLLNVAGTRERNHKNNVLRYVRT